MRQRIIIATDASLAPSRGCGAYAFYIYGADNMTRSSGHIEGRQWSSSFCELMALRHALKALTSFPGWQDAHISIYCDNQGVLGMIPAFIKHSRGPINCRHIISDCARVLRQCKSYELNYIRGHVRGTDLPRLMHDWCDLAAHNAMRNMQGLRTVSFRDVKVKV